MADQEQLDAKAKELEKQIEELKNSAIRRSTWGLVFLLICLVSAVLTLGFVLLAALAAGVTLTPTLITTGIALISGFISLLLLWGEKGLAERLKPLQEKIETMHKEMESQRRERESEPEENG